VSAAASPVPEVSNEPSTSHQEQGLEASMSEDEWTRDEDKVILQAFEQGGTANILVEVKDLLPQRSPEQVINLYICVIMVCLIKVTLLQIKSRFETLMQLLAKMSSEAVGE
jgi:hypothetical protein